MRRCSNAFGNIGRQQCAGSRQCKVANPDWKLLLILWFVGRVDPKVLLLAGLILEKAVVQRTCCHDHEVPPHLIVVSVRRKLFEGKKEGHTGLPWVWGGHSLTSLLEGVTRLATPVSGTDARLSARLIHPIPGKWLTCPRKLCRIHLLHVTRQQLPEHAMGDSLQPFTARFNKSLRVESRAERLTGDAGVVVLREITNWPTAAICLSSCYMRDNHEKLTLIVASDIIETVCCKKVCNTCSRGPATPTRDRIPSLTKERKKP